MNDLSQIEQSLVLQFQVEVETDETVAIHFLSSANFDYQTAINLYEQTYGTKKRRTTNYQNSDQQATNFLEQGQGQVQGQGQRKGQGQYRRTMEVNGGSTIPRRRSTRLILKTNKQSLSSKFEKLGATKLAKQFKPPYDLYFEGTLEDAKQFGSKKLKWIMVNLQRTNCLSSGALNRDVWSDKGVRKLIQEKFLFFQFYQNQEEYIQYKQYYPYTPYNTKGIFAHYNLNHAFEETILPRIDFIDPRTGERKFWFLTQNLSPNAIVSHITNFLDQNVLFSLIDPFELDLEKQMQIAIAESTENYRNQLKQFNKEKEIYQEKEKGASKEIAKEKEIEKEKEKEKEKGYGSDIEIEINKETNMVNFDNYSQFDFPTTSSELESESESESESDTESETETESELEIESEIKFQPNNQKKLILNSKPKTINLNNVRTKNNNKTTTKLQGLPTKTNNNGLFRNRKRQLETIDNLWWRKEPNTDNTKNVVPIKVLFSSGETKIFNFYKSEKIDILFKKCRLYLQQSLLLNPEFELYDMRGITRKALSGFRKKTIQELSLGNSLVRLSLL
ncbi:ubx domain-containing protein [Anaeramoeba flamelloides]|uniref:Ubx domain-containing protein n=1 Tax=Anaeramoeba flamelloides TaxID=1746091 RepID=A0ABQ8XGN1_9EUKA|nr:ubx domain-containing protein [Anaeramoeba flamelloides]